MKNIKIFTMGFLFNKRIFPQANDCKVRCNSASSEKTNIFKRNKNQMNTNEF